MGGEPSLQSQGSVITIREGASSPGAFLDRRKFYCELLGSNVMSETIDSELIRAWIDDDLVETVDRVPDDVAEFNFAVDMSNILMHVLRRTADGPLLIGQEIEYDQEICSRIKGLSTVERNNLVARIRETLSAAPVVYGFYDDRGNNVRFHDMERIFIEYRLYPDSLSQHELMTGLVNVWKAMRYVDDIVALIDIVER